MPKVFEELDKLLVYKKPAELFDETQRVCDLEQLWEWGPEARPAIERLTNKVFGTWKLRDLQVQALYTIHKCRGAIPNLDVGEGKTLVASLAGTVANATTVVVLTKKALIPEFWVEYKKYKKHFKVFPKDRLHLVSYSMLSSRKNADILERLRPDLLIADEAHNLRNPNSARTRRVFSYLRGNTDCLFVPMTATFLKNSVYDIQNAALFALRHKAPIPVDDNHIEAWSACLDVGKEPTAGQMEYLFKLQRAMDLPLQADKNAFRRAFYKRFATCEGVVTTEQPSELPPIHLYKINDLEVPESVRSALKHIREYGETPDGEEVIVDEERMGMLERQLSCGFIYKPDWDAVGGYDEEWVMKRKIWGKALRQELMDNHAPGYDTPFFVTAKIVRDLKKDPDLVDKSKLHWAWSYWDTVRDRPAPPKKTVWLDDYFIEDVLARVDSLPQPVLMWRLSEALEEALAPQLIDRGWRIYGAGSDIPEDGRGTYSALLTSNRFKAGQNLQDWNRAIVLEPFSDALMWQQVLGRIHRPGLSGPCHWHIYQHTTPFKRSIANAMEYAEYEEEMTVIKMKLLHGEWH